MPERVDVRCPGTTKRAWPFDCCCSHQSVASPSLCFCQGSRWTFWAHFVVFSWLSALSWCWEFFEFGVLLFDCFVYRQNVSCLKRFTFTFTSNNSWTNYNDQLSTNNQYHDMVAHWRWFHDDALYKSTTLLYLLTLWCIAIYASHYSQWRA